METTEVEAPVSHETTRVNTSSIHRMPLSHGGKPVLCPVCGEPGTLYRRHTRGLLPVLAKLFTPFRRYRCMSCGETIWRHSHSKPKVRSKLTSLRSLGWILGLIVLSILLARWIVE